MALLRPIVPPTPDNRFDRTNESAFRRMVEQSVREAVADVLRLDLITQQTVLAFGADPTGLADSSGAIQRALDTNTIARVPPGTFLVGSTIVVADGQELHMDRQAVLRPTSDIVVLQVAPLGTMVSGGEIDASQLSAYTSPAVQFRGTSQPNPSGTSRPARLRDLTVLGVRSEDVGSIGLHFVTAEGEGRIHGVMVNGLTVREVETAILLEVNAVSTGVANINGLSFSDVWTSHCRHTLVADREIGGVNDTRCAGNIFVNFVAQSDTNEDIQISYAGTRSVFLGVSFFDFAGSTITELTADSQNNVLLGNFTANLLDDAGIDNAIIQLTDPWQMRGASSPTLPVVAPVPHIVENGSVTLDETYAGHRTRQASGSTTLTLPDSTTVPVGTWFIVQKINAGTVNLALDAGDTGFRVYGGPGAGANTANDLVIPDGGYVTAYNFGAGFWDAFVSENVTIAP